MKLIRPTIWIVIGIVIGSFASMAVSTAKAQAAAPLTSSAKLQYFTAKTTGLNVPGAFIGFLSDGQGGCWIVAGDKGLSVAVAPHEDCR